MPRGDSRASRRAPVVRWISVWIDCARFAVPRSMRTSQSWPVPPSCPSPLPGKPPWPPVSRIFVRPHTRKGGGGGGPIGGGGGGGGGGGAIVTGGSAGGGARHPERTATPSAKRRGRMG